MISPQLGQRIRASRLELGLSGTELARKIGKSQPYISDLERGQRTPSLLTLKALSEALGKSMAYFLSDEEPLRTDGTPIPYAKEDELKHVLADRIVGHLLTAGLLRTGEQAGRERVRRIVRRAIDSAYVDIGEAGHDATAAGSAAAR